jgi:hypothetical protein
MSGKRQAAIRELLRASDGMTALELRKHLNIRPKDGAAIVTQILRTMADAYVDRWIKDDDQWVPVWAVVDVPEDCPKPDEKANLQKASEKTRLPMGRTAGADHASHQ